MLGAIILRIITILTGFLILDLSILSLAKRKMTEPVCLAWGVISVCIILAGILLSPTELSRYISNTGMVLFLLIGFCLLYGAYTISIIISKLMRRNTELAIQITLMKQENEEIKKTLEALVKAERTAEGHEEDTDRN